MRLGLGVESGDGGLFPIGKDRIQNPAGPCLPRGGADGRSAAGLEHFSGARRTNRLAGPRLRKSSAIRLRRIVVLRGYRGWPRAKPLAASGNLTAWLTRDDDCDRAAATRKP